MMTQQKQNSQALKQRNAESERALQDANLEIQVRNTMIEVAEKDGAAFRFVQLYEFKKQVC